MNLFSRNLAVWIFIIILLIALFSFFNGNPGMQADQEIRYSEFLEAVDAREVNDVVIQGPRIEGHYKDGGREFFTLAPSNDDSLVETLRNGGVSFKVEEYDRGAKSLLEIIFSWFPFLLLIGVWIFFMRQMQGGGGKAMGFGKSKAKLLTEKMGRVTFDDVAGVDEA
ncbi:MAG: ATP-dependent metallopeptidase FtsH/Yme1/Tma family protein, partial [Alphaproteobacteria bacterium]|nr:ATP-dependent metallopeptidase FtsH/Yme1/Tma family protein [Alphaproteobacteria bacterium]